jgi:hypothetical protein
MGNAPTSKRSEIETNIAKDIAMATIFSVPDDTPKGQRFATKIPGPQAGPTEPTKNPTEQQQNRTTKNPLV